MGDPGGPGHAGDPGDSGSPGDPKTLVENLTKNLAGLGGANFTLEFLNKKHVKFDQGLDFLKVWRGKSRKTIGKRRENEEKTVKFKNFRV